MRNKRELLLDYALEAYIDWREQSAAVEHAYRRWNVAGRADASVAFAAYVAALDREELASSDYARIVSRAAAA